MAQHHSELYSSEFGQDFRGRFPVADDIVPAMSNDISKQEEAMDIHGLQTESQVKPAPSLQGPHTKKAAPEGSMKKPSSVETEPNLAIPPRPMMPSSFNSGNVHKQKSRPSRRARNVPARVPSLEDFESRLTLPRHAPLSRTSSFIFEEVRHDSGQGAQKHKDEVTRHSKMKKTLDENAVSELSPHAPEFQPLRPSLGLLSPLTVQSAPTHTRERFQPQLSPPSGPKNNSRHNWNRDRRPYYNKQSKNGGVQYARQMSFAGQPPMHPPFPSHNSFQGGPIPFQSGLQSGPPQPQFNSLLNSNQFQVPMPDNMKPSYLSHGHPRAVLYPGHPQTQSRGLLSPNFYNGQLQGPYATPPYPNVHSMSSPGHNLGASGYQLPNHIRVVSPLNQGPSLNQIHPKDLTLPAPGQGYYEITMSGPLWKPGPFDGSNVHRRSVSVAVSATEAKEDDSQALEPALEELSLKVEAGEGEKQSEEVEEKKDEPVKRKVIYF
jgi:hypothetical protein